MWKGRAEVNFQWRIQDLPRQPWKSRWAKRGGGGGGGGGLRYIVFLTIFRGTSTLWGRVPSAYMTDLCGEKQTKKVGKGGGGGAADLLTPPPSPGSLDPPLRTFWTMIYLEGKKRNFRTNISISTKIVLFCSLKWMLNSTNAQIV